jgi:Flp pilus assembly protein TadD
MGLAKLLMMQEKPQEALQYLRMAVQSDPLNRAAHCQLGTAYRRLQMKELAQKEMHLSQGIKHAKDRVEELYREMNRQPKPRAEDVPDAETLDHEQ